MTTLSRLESQWGEPRSETVFGTGARVAGSSVIVAGPAASSGQPLVLAVLEAVNPDLAPVCQVGEEERAGRAGVTSMLFVGSSWSGALNVDVKVSAVASLPCTVNAS